MPGGSSKLSLRICNSSKFFLRDLIFKPENVFSGLGTNYQSSDFEISLQKCRCHYLPANPNFWFVLGCDIKLRWRFRHLTQYFSCCAVFCRCKEPLRAARPSLSSCVERRPLRLDFNILGAWRITFRKQTFEGVVCDTCEVLFLNSLSFVCCANFRFHCLTIKLFLLSNGSFSKRQTWETLLGFYKTP